MALFPIRVSVPTSDPAAATDAQINAAVTQAWRITNSVNPLSTGVVRISRTADAVVVDFDATIADVNGQPVADKLRSLVADRVRAVLPAPENNLVKPLLIGFAAIIVLAGVVAVSRSGR